MANLEQTDGLWQSLESIAADEGLLLYDAQRLGDAGIRVFVAKPDNATETATATPHADGSMQMNVSSGDCTRLCKRLIVFFSVEGPQFGLGAEPQIEVSSPGINRVLRTMQHFLNAQGERVKVVLVEPIEFESEKSQSILIGSLDSVEDPRILLTDEVSGKQVKIEFSMIKKASVEFKF